MRVLIIEDNPDIAANLGDYLEDHGHTVDFAGDGITGLHLAVVNDFDAIVLDLALPGMDGIEVCRKLRQEAGKDTPVLMLTARDRLEDKLAGFETGADDYLVKPFELQEVEARLNVLASRGRRRSSRELRVGDLVYNVDTLNVNRAGTEIYLNPIGLKLLKCLMESSPNVVSRSELEMKVWGEEMPDSDSLRVHIHSLRSALDKPFGSNMIQTRHGIGYRLVESDAIPSKA
jgi:DNA-binding response OmpR family regulator